MIIRNGLVFGEDRRFTKRDLYINNGIIVSDENEADGYEVMDAQGLYVIPGLVDIHSHGAVGCDFSDADPDGIKKILEYEAGAGVTSYCPTSMTLPLDELTQIFSSADSFSWAPAQPGSHTGTDSACTDKLSHVLGFNMEGPFLDPVKKGAHVEKYITNPSADFFRKCNSSAKGRIRLVTLAPNMPGAPEFIRACRDEVTISLGHTSADYSCSLSAMEAGADHVTHLYNAMQPFAHRDPGLIGAAADTKSSMVELICDGIHIHESVIRATFSLFGAERICLISDSMRAAGLSDGAYTLGGQDVFVHGRRATLSDGTIAGSVTNLYDCMRTAVSFGIPLEQAVAAATVNPAKSIGMDKYVGSLAPGKQADIVIMKPDLTRERVILS